ncbi:g5355 [Coccomyxa viridis]|uniref:G5355 protein n=1 Tax=Coccomyxa viridis TaxID=1274662 RepID=A0ABP1FXS5_9CHLO
MELPVANKLSAQAQELEDEAVQLEEQKLPIAAAAKLQKAGELHDGARILRQGHSDDILALRQDMDKMEKAVERQKDMGTVCHAALFQRPSVPSYAVAECKRKAFVRYEGEESPTSVLDMATGEEMEPDKVVPAFIYKLSWPRDLLETAEMSVLDTENIILTCPEVASSWHHGDQSAS